MSPEKRIANDSSFAATICLNRYLLGGARLYGFQWTEVRQRRKTTFVVLIVNPFGLAIDRDRRNGLAGGIERERGLVHLVIALIRQLDFVTRLAAPKHEQPVASGAHFVAVSFDDHIAVTQTGLPRRLPFGNLEHGRLMAE